MRDGQPRKAFSSTTLIRVKVWTLWWPVHVWQWCLMLSEPQFQPVASRHGICPCHQGKEIYKWHNVVIQYIQVVSWPHSLSHNVAEPRPDQLQQPDRSRGRCYDLVAAVGRKALDITSSASLFTLMFPSLWNRVNLDPLDHMTFVHCSRVQSLCSLANWSIFSN